MLPIDLFKFLDSQKLILKNEEPDEKELTLQDTVLNGLLLVVLVGCVMSTIAVYFYQRTPTPILAFFTIFAFILVFIGGVLINVNFQSKSKSKNVALGNYEKESLPQGTLLIFLLFVILIGVIMSCIAVYFYQRTPTPLLAFFTIFGLVLVFIGGVLINVLHIQSQQNLSIHHKKWVMWLSFSAIVLLTIFSVAFLLYAFLLPIAPVAYV
eukprot:Awhi_evm1s1165